MSAGRKIPNGRPGSSVINDKAWKSFIEVLKARVRGNKKKSRNADGSKREPILKRKPK